MYKRIYSFIVFISLFSTPLYSSNLSMTTFCESNYRYIKNYYSTNALKKLNFGINMSY